MKWNLALAALAITASGLVLESSLPAPEGPEVGRSAPEINGKAWLNEVGEIISHAATVTERFTPIDKDTIQYDATISDPQVYTRHWSVSFPIKRQEGELLEVACHEGNEDLAHLKEIRDQARAKKGRQGS